MCHSNSMSFPVLEKNKIDTLEKYFLIHKLLTFNIVYFRPSKTKTTNMLVIASPPPLFGRFFKFLFIL